MSGLHLGPRCRPEVAAADVGCQSSVTEQTAAPRAVQRAAVGTSLIQSMLVGRYRLEQPWTPAADCLVIVKMLSGVDHR